MIELRNSRARAAGQQLQAAVNLILACAHDTDGPELGELLILIREAGIDPLEAAFATGVRRFDKSGEYAADGALSVTAWLNGNASSPEARPPSGSRSASNWSGCPRPTRPLLAATSGTSMSRSWRERLKTWGPRRCETKKATS